MEANLLRDVCGGGFLSSLHLPFLDWDKIV